MQSKFRAASIAAAVVTAAIGGIAQQPPPQGPGMQYVLGDLQVDDSQSVKGGTK